MCWPCGTLHHTARFAGESSAGILTPIALGTHRAQAILLVVGVAEMRPQIRRAFSELADLLGFDCRR
jgi:hypothetical protein